MAKLIGTEKQIKWANEIISDIKKYSGEIVTEERCSVIIGLGKGVNNINVEGCFELIEKYSEFAEKNNLESKEYGTLNDSDYDLMESAVNKKEISMNVFNAIYDGMYKNIKG
ncbi:MAG: hypothetical protein GY849_09975 [Deltaproteobacteria bacterium]|nr:hypothetical protein [Deltaproteobacteria bacterium]